MTTHPRIIISGLKGGSGKTLLSLGLAAALTRQGIRVKPYKKGPDYIDAAWLALAAGRDATNLDPFFLPPARLRALFQHSLPAHHLALIEGNRGLFDGRDAQGSCATAELAHILDCPVIVSLDCTKMTRTAAALVLGLTMFDPRIRIAGIILNQVGTSRQATLIRQAVEQHTCVPVLGALPRLPRNPLPERHMGLASGDMGDAARAVLEQLGTFIREHVDMARVRNLANAAPALPPSPPFWEGDARPARVRIGYVRDEALWFYYGENLEALRRAGAELVRLSFADKEPWPELDGIYLGGGFPEDHAPRLSQSPHLAELQRWSDAGMPIYAECGGFMVLARAISRADASHRMAGIFPVEARFSPRPQGLGYVEGRVTCDNPFLPRGSLVRGHEFHYSHCVPDADAAPCCALALDCGRGMGQGQDALIVRRTWASYTHIFAPALPQWADNFVAAAAAFATEAGRGRG